MECAAQVREAIRRHHYPVLVQKKVGEDLFSSDCESRERMRGGTRWRCDRCEHVGKVVAIFMCCPFCRVLCTTFHMRAHPVQTGLGGVSVNGSEQIEDRFFPRLFDITGS